MLAKQLFRQKNGFKGMYYFKCIHMHGVKCACYCNAAGHVQRISGTIFSTVFFKSTSRGAVPGVAFHDDNIGDCSGIQHEGNWRSNPSCVHEGVSIIPPKGKIHFSQYHQKARKIPGCAADTIKGSD
uniref:(northern house mosquito) hypothetical protein n=1 Tax=Culex pipiens TaxID=7175 RepID=A0A8D8CR93_CULPI